MVTVTGAYAHMGNGKGRGNRECEGENGGLSLCFVLSFGGGCIAKRYYTVDYKWYRTAKKDTAGQYAEYGRKSCCHCSTCFYDLEGLAWMLDSSEARRFNYDQSCTPKQASLGPQSGYWWCCVLGGWKT